LVDIIWLNPFEMRWISSSRDLPLGQSSHSIPHNRSLPILQKREQNVNFCEDTCSECAGEFQQSRDVGIADDNKGMGIF